MKNLFALLLLLLPVQALALGPYSNAVLDEAGNGIAAVNVTVYLADTVTLASLYSDNGTTPIANPLTTDYAGRFEFWAANGLYDVCITGSGVTPFCLENQKIIDEGQVGLPALNITDPRFGAISDDDIDDTAAIQAAIDAADAMDPKPSVRIPTGDFDVYSTITFGRVPLIGDGYYSRLVSHITDGSAVIENDAVSDVAHIENLSIVNYDDNTTGNFIGVYLDSNRGHMSNVRVRRAATGFYVEGWIHDFVNLWATRCTTGFSGVTLNSVRINFNAEICGTGMTIASGGAIQLTGVNEDNGFGLIADGISGLDACVWFEGNDSTDIKMGETALCTDIILTGVLSSGDASATPSIFDNVNGLDVSRLSIPTRPGVYLTSNVIGVIGIPKPVAGTIDSDYGWLRTVRTEDGIIGAENLFPDPYFAFGFADIPDTSSTARETLSIVDSLPVMGNALRVTAVGATGSNYCNIALGAGAASALAGGAAQVGAWVYIPDDDTNYPDQTGSVIKPDVHVEYYDGSWHASSTASQNWRNNGWSFFASQFDIPLNATNVRVVLSQSRDGAATIPAGTYVDFSGVYLGRAPAAITDIMAGRWRRGEYADASKAGVYDVRLYGAVPDDSVDDTAAIQAAIDAAEKAHGGVVQFPVGQFRLTGAGLTIADHGITLRGASRGYENETDRGTILVPLSAMSGPMLTISSGGVFSIYRSGVEGITFRSGGAYYSDGLVSLINCRDCFVRDCTLYMNDSEENDNTALQIISTSSLSSSGNQVDNCYIHSTRYIPGPAGGTGYGLTITNSGGTYNTANYITDTKFYDPSTVGDGALWVWEAGTAVGVNMFSNCHFGTTDNGSNKGILLEGAGGGTVLTNCIIDGNAADTLLTFGDLGAGAAACYFQGSIDGVWVDENDGADDLATVIDNGDDNQVNIRSIRLIPRSAAPASPAEGDLYYDSDTDDVMVYTALGWEILFDGAD